MKKALSTIAVCLSVYLNLFSQCTPNAATGTPGLTPAPSAVTCIERGVFYDFTLYFENFSSFSCSGFTANITSGTINSLSNLPCGITWQANKTTFAPGETGCIRISGTTTDAVGQYPLTVNMTFVLNIFGTSYPVSGTLQDLIQQMQSFGCSAPSVNIDYYSRVVDQGTPCPAIGNLPNGTSSGTTCPVSTPSVSISGNDTICAGTSTTLTANVTNGTGTVTYSWSSGSSAQLITVNPASTTTYSVTATASNGSATASSTVTVNQRPNAAFTATPSGTSASVTNTTTGASSYSWDFGDGQTSTTQSPPAHTYSSNGTYTITLIATNTCGNDTATQQVTITGGIGPSVTISGNTTICSGDSTTLTANATNTTGTVTYSWSPGGGSAQTKTISPTSTATYSVTVTDQNGSATTSATVTVNQIPNASFTASAASSTVTITNTTTGASSYSWNFGDGQTSTAQNPSPHTYSSNGNYTITLVATSSCGSDTATQQVIIPAGNGPSVSVSGDTTVCYGAPITLTANATNTAGTVTYSWSPISGSGQTKIVNPTSTTTYSVTVTAQNGTATASATVTVNPRPSITFTIATISATITITNTTIGASSYSWNFGDGQVSTEQNPSHTYLSNGNFIMRLIAVNTCGNDTAIQTVTIVSAGIGSVANSFGLKIYPNPFNSAATVEVENTTGAFDFSIFSITGVKMLERSNMNEGKFIIQKDALPHGVYFIEVRSEKGFARSKVVIY